MRSMHLFEGRQPEATSIFRKYLPKISPIPGAIPKSNSWDIPNTIGELSYLVHSHYRYYGKFPPVVAGQLLDQFPPQNADQYVLDNFCGSGTTLVEARLRGIRSIGIDISWLSCLASNVKARNADLNAIRGYLNSIATEFYEHYKNTDDPQDSFSSKWFSSESARGLATLQRMIGALKRDSARDFLLVALLGIVRRVSRAFDGEVRPHINKLKRERNVLEAFSKKVRDMIKDHEDYMDLVDSNIQAQCLLSSNTSLPSQVREGYCHLAISHPPYLNSFNYTPVFSLEFYWGAPFESQFSDGQPGLHKQELVAHPANERTVLNYFEHLKKCYEETYRVQPKGAHLAVVIGDCTRNGHLVPVIDETADIIQQIGYTPSEYNYRTTHYGLGKYAYKHRADYHGNAEKRDAILVFTKK